MDYANACFDNPIICIGYGALFVNGKDCTDKRYEQSHMQWVLESDPVTLVRSEKKLIEAIGSSLKYPEYKRKERLELHKNIYGKLYGHSGERMIDAICSST